MWKDEADFKNDLVSMLRAKGYDAIRHEDKQQNFIPDISFARNGGDGWIEVKYEKQLPPSLHHIKHWTLGQEHWLKGRGNAGRGSCYLLLGTGDSHFAMWHYSKFDYIRHVSIWDAIERANFMSDNMADFMAMVDRYLLRY